MERRVSIIGKGGVASLAAVALFALFAALAIPERDGFLAPPLPEVALAQ
ncbi:MAG: hypothetical protein H0W05_06890, partial [Thermoleophilaceae bacterium]|nr:hypothetical protein [Thermoleophilaceae bacterium]